MTKDEDKAFSTYENTDNPHVIIHRKGCNYIRMRGGTAIDGIKHWHDFQTYEAAETYAKGLNLKLSDCQQCLPYTKQISDNILEELTKK